MRRYFFAALTTLLLVPSLGHAQYLDELSTTGDAVYVDDATIMSRSLLTQIGDIIGILLSLLGVVFLVLIIYAGFLWMTARGDSKQVTKAKDILAESIVGLIILFASYSIADWVINNLT